MPVMMVIGNRSHRFGGSTGDEFGCGDIVTGTDEQTSLAWDAVVASKTCWRKL